MIPKIHHSVWTSGNAFAPKYYEWRLSWMRQNPDWNFKLWTIKDIVDRYVLEPDAVIDVAARCFSLLGNNDLHWVLKSDIARWLVVFFEGGVYSDTDVECVKPMYKFLSDPSFCGRSITPGVLSNAVFGAEPGNDLMLEIALAQANAITGHIEDANAHPCDYSIHIASELLKKCGRIYPAEFFNPWGSGLRQEGKEPSAADFPVAHTVHHWTGMDPDGWYGSRAPAPKTGEEPVCIVKPRIIEGK